MSPSSWHTPLTRFSLLLEREERKQYLLFLHENKATYISLGFLSPTNPGSPVHEDGDGDNNSNSSNSDGPDVLIHSAPPASSSDTIQDEENLRVPQDSDSSATRQDGEEALVDA